MIFGHLTVTAAVHREVRRHWPLVPVALGALVFGAYLPDILDKPIGLVTGLSGRGYGHSIVVQATLLVAALVLFPRYRGTVGTIALGAAIHLLEDGVEPRVLLAPLLGPIPFMPPRNFFDTLLSYYTGGSALFWLEAIATGYWIAVGVARLMRTRKTRGVSPRVSSDAM